MDTNGEKIKSFVDIKCSCQLTGGCKKCTGNHTIIIKQSSKDIFPTEISIEDKRRFHTINFKN